VVERRDLAALVVPRAGSLDPVGGLWEPWRLCVSAGAVVAPVAAYLWDLQASGRPETTLRTYSIALLVPVLLGGRGGLGSGDPG
jgi:hypothetical protein